MPCVFPCLCFLESANTRECILVWKFKSLHPTCQSASVKNQRKMLEEAAKGVAQAKSICIENICQTGRSRVFDNSYSGRRKSQINISQREDVEIQKSNFCLMFIDFTPQSYLRKCQSKWNVCFYVFLFAQIVANENRPHILYQSVKVSTPECH